MKKKRNRRILAMVMLAIIGMFSFAGCANSFNALEKETLNGIDDVGKTGLKITGKVLSYIWIGMFVVGAVCVFQPRTKPLGYGLIIGALVVAYISFKLSK